MKYKTLSMADARAILAGYDAMDDVEFDDLVSHWKSYDTIENDDSYAEFRASLLEVFQEYYDKGNKADYLLDLKIGLRLYQLMPLNDDFTIIMANDDDIWRYISVKVMPDITYLRYPKPESAIRDSGGRLNHKRFYSHKRRIWLKTLWWYIHLSWQGNEEKTFEALKENGVDNINKLIETPGKGYRLTLYRNMIREYSETTPHKTKDFAAMTKLNNAKCMAVEPGLISGGERAYVKQLVSEVIRGGDGDGAEK